MLKDFEADMANLHGELNIAGLSCLILRGSELCWFKGFGYADLTEKTPVTLDTPFHLASLTKTFASVLLMQLVEQDKLHLDTPVVEFGIRLESRGTITVRHLLSHTSSGNPGEVYHYDGSRFGQLDRVIEQVTGCSFKENVDKIIIHPLGLKNTGCANDDLEVPLASPYRLNNRGKLIKDTYQTYFGCSAGLVASVSDYSQYLIALKENRFLRRETLALAMTPNKSTAGHDLPYGLGWFVETINGTKVTWHYGYWNCVSTLLVSVPEQDLNFLAFANTDALSRGFSLGIGRILSSPAASRFLERFVFNQH